MWHRQPVTFLRSRQQRPPPMVLPPVVLVPALPLLVQAP